MSAKLLIVDDDTELTRLLQELFAHDGFDLDAHHSGADAAPRAIQGGYALVILDVMLPDINGLEVLRQIRNRSNLPVVLLTARGDDVDRVVGLELGADDYVPKPFNARELVARVRAVLRRADGRTAPGVRSLLVVDDVQLDAASRTVLRAGDLVELTGVEFDILRVLLESAGQTVSRETIAEKVLGRQFDPLDRSVDMHISKLRRKLGPRTGGEERIKTVRSAGYIFTVPLPPR